MAHGHRTPSDGLYNEEPLPGWSHYAMPDCTVEAGATGGQCGFPAQGTAWRKADDAMVQCEADRGLTSMQSSESNECTKNT